MSDADAGGQHHAICPLCVRVVSKLDRDELQDVIENHNEQRHDGNEVAEIVSAEELDGFMDRVKSQHGMEVYEEIAPHIVDVDPWGVLA